MNKLKKGFVQIYTGDGKGKTTAAIGQAVRAAGQNMKTLIVHFMKDYPYGEIEGLKPLKDWITLEQYGNDSFVLKKQHPGPEEKAEIYKAIERVKKAMSEGEFDIIVLDELCVTFYFGLLNVEDVLPLFDLRPDNVELIITGRYCPQELLDKADLITEMKEVRHYYQKGILSRKGIES